MTFEAAPDFGLTGNQPLHVHVLEDRAYDRHREQVGRRQWHHDAGRHVADRREEIDGALGVSLQLDSAKLERAHRVV